MNYFIFGFSWALFFSCPLMKRISTFFWMSTIWIHACIILNDILYSTLKGNLHSISVDRNMQSALLIYFIKLLINFILKLLIPIAHGSRMKETYLKLQNILKGKKKCEYHQSSTCTDLKVIPFISKIQQGFTNCNCFLCEWDSWARDKYFCMKKMATGRRQYSWQGKCWTSGINWQDKKPLHIKLDLLNSLLKRWIKMVTDLNIRYTSVSYRWSQNKRRYFS